jgi:hypothetical protein
VIEIRSESRLGIARRRANRTTRLGPSRWSQPRELDERHVMFTLSIALLALALILGAFGVLGVAGGQAIAAAFVLLLFAGVAMAAYWRRRAV